MKIISPEQLLGGYAQGIFPMSDSRDDEGFSWYSARRRGIIPMDEFRVSSNARRLIRNRRYRIGFNERFRTTMELCAARNSTWISELIVDSYAHLHQLGYAHSVEVYSGEQMVGGLYGVSLGAAFFGESMFNYEPESSKVALWWCHKALAYGGFELWDTQFYTEHLAQFGCIEIPQTDYEQMLEVAIRKEATFSDPRRVDEDLAEQA